jgi:hypothetical protein
LTHNDDDYLVVVTYFNCTDQNAGEGDACEPGGDANLVDVEVKIFIDGDLAPRDGVRAIDGQADSVQPTSLKFQIKPNQWKVVAEINWNGNSDKRPGKKYKGDALVTDTIATTFPLCTWSADQCFWNLVPVWGTPSEANGATSYKAFVESPPPDSPGSTDPVGTCE